MSLGTALPTVQINGDNMAEGSEAEAPTISNSSINRLGVLKRILGDNGVDSGAEKVSEPTAPLPPSKVKEADDMIKEDVFEVNYFESVQSIDSRFNSEEYFNEQMRKFSRLHKNVVSSKKIVEELRNYMTNFESNLSSLSSQMNKLKSQSELLRQQLDLNSKFEKKFIPIVTDFIISPDIINSITKDKVSPQWCDNISYLELKLEIYSKYQKEIAQYEASGDSNEIDPKNLRKFLEEMKHLVDLLVVAAIKKIRDLFVTKIKLIRYSKSFALQMLQNDLLQMKELYQFLLTHNKPLALDLRQAYILTIRWYYFKNFGKYLYSLEKLKLYNIDKNYLLGNINDDLVGSQIKSPAVNTRTTSTSSWLSPFSASSPLKSSRSNTKKPATVSLSDYFSVNNRLDILTHDDPTVLPAQIAETNPLTYWLETPFRSFNLALIDNGSIEYLFLSEFFQISNPQEVSKIFQEIFQGVFQLGLNFTNSYLVYPDNYDFYSILICIKMTQMFLFKLQHRKIPVMENYLNSQVMALWPKYQLIVDANCANLKKVLIKNSSTSYFSSLTHHYKNDSMYDTSSNKAVVPHPITQQFATLLASLLKISSIDTSNPSLISDINQQPAVISRAATPLAQEYLISKLHQKKTQPPVSKTDSSNRASRSSSVSGVPLQQTEPLSTSVTRLRNEFENVLNKLSLTVAGGSTASSAATNKKREAFLYNNYFLLYTVTSRCEGPVAETEKEHFKLLMDAYKQSLD